MSVRDSKEHWVSVLERTGPEVRFKDVLRAAVLLFDRLIPLFRDSISRASRLVLKNKWDRLPKLSFVVDPPSDCRSKKVRSTLRRFLSQCLPTSLDLFDRTDPSESSWSFNIEPVFGGVSLSDGMTLELVVEESQQMMVRFEVLLRELRTFRWSDVRWDLKSLGNVSYDDLSRCASVPRAGVHSWLGKFRILMLFNMTAKALGLQRMETAIVNHERSILVPVDAQSLPLLLREIPGLLGDLRIAKR